MGTKFWSWHIIPIVTRRHRWKSFKSKVGCFQIAQPMRIDMTKKAFSVIGVGENGRSKVICFLLGENIEICFLFTHCRESTWPRTSICTPHGWRSSADSLSWYPGNSAWRSQYHCHSTQCHHLNSLACHVLGCCPSRMFGAWVWENGVGIQSIWFWFLPLPHGRYQNY